MKRSISILLCLALIFSSFTFVSAVDWSTTDQQNLSNAASRLNTIIQLLSSGGSLYSLINTISNNVNTIKGYLTDGGTSVAGWVHNINTWMSPILNAIQQTPTDLFTIIGALGYYDSNNTYHPYLNNLNYSLSNPKPGLNSLNNNDLFNNAHLSLKWVYSNGSNTGQYAIPIIQSNGGVADGTTYWSAGSPIGNLAYMIYRDIQNNSNAYVYRWGADLTGYNSQQSLVSFADPDSTVTFNPLSATDGIYKYLNAINTPLARLGYVLASDSRIEAQEAASANEQAVVDNFIDSSGDGSVPTSSFSDVSGLSSGVTSNLSTDASPAQIWDIFNSDHGSWFSQETANQLDTTTRTRGFEFDTPLLDQQMEDIYKSLGGGK